MDICNKFQTDICKKCQTDIRKNFQMDFRKVFQIDFQHFQLGPKGHNDAAEASALRRR